MQQVNHCNLKNKKTNKKLEQRAEEKIKRFFLREDLFESVIFIINLKFNYFLKNVVLFFYLNKFYTKMFMFQAFCYYL